jgi:hypothetical protein
MRIVRSRNASAVVMRLGADRFLWTCTDERVKRSVEETLDLLKDRYDLGMKIPKTQFPAFYVEEWGVNNLYKCNLALGWRLTYTLTSDVWAFESMYSKSCPILSTIDGFATEPPSGLLCRCPAFS